VQTSDYFAVGSTIEVLDTTWADATPGTTLTGDDYNSNNLYRKFKVTGHVTNQFNREFAKLDSFPADDNVVEPPLSTNIAARPKYNLKITSNNGTVHTYENRDTANTKGEGLPVVVTVNEVQVVVLGTGMASKNEDQVWKLYYKGEETQNMDYMSTPAQVAEEINGFSALSGPVTVEGEATQKASTTGYPKYVVTFAAQDGDVAEMTAVSTIGTNIAGDTPTSGNTDAVTVVTRANGWSIESPIDFGIGGLHTMQAGGIINITAAETCAFTEAGAATAGYYCYDGVCGAPAASGTTHQAALRGILDDNGDAILGTASLASSASNPNIFTVTMPSGKSCDGLELRGTTSAITKTVNKHNNGKSFKITRSFLKSAIVTGTYVGTGDGASTTTVTLANAQGHQLLKTADSLVISGGTNVNLGVGLTDMDRTTFTRTTTAASAAATTDEVSLGVAALAGVAAPHADVQFRLARHVITLDSMPTASAATTKKTLHYTSPVGSCSVAETTKGTYESYECSNRGACDGKSGLCTCYEGYSGQSCQTQTVLV